MMNAEQRQEFLRRRTEIGASEAGAVLGVDPYNGPDDVYDRITALRDHGEIIGDDETNDHIERGVWMEPVIAQVYRERTGRRLRSQSEPDTCPDFPHLKANPDRIILATETDPTGLLEIKAPARERFDALARERIIPDSWMVQGQAQLACRPGIAYVEYAVHHADRWSQTLIFRVDRHDEFIKGTLLPELERFWGEHVEPRKRPEPFREPVPTPPEWHDAMAPNLEDEDLAEAARKYREAKELEKAVKEESKLWRTKLQALLSKHGDPQLAFLPDVKVMHRWVTPKTGKLDTKRLAAFLRENTDVRIESFYDDPVPYRRLLVNERKKERGL